MTGPVAFAAALWIAARRWGWRALAAGLCATGLCWALTADTTPTDAVPSPTPAPSPTPGRPR